jgi:hypothetical protein
VDCPFSWKRYTSLKKVDFTDDQTVVAPQDLMGAGPDAQPFNAEPGQIPHGGNEAGGQFAEQRLNQMINQVAHPVNPVMGQQQEQLIQQLDGNEIGEDEFEEMQAALIASMADNEQIVIGEEDEEGAQGQQPGML